MKKYAAFLLAFAWCAAVAAQPKKQDWKERVVALDAAIWKHYYQPAQGQMKEFYPPRTGAPAASYLWPLCALLHAATEVEQLGFRPSYALEVLGLLQPYYDTTAPAPAYSSYLVLPKREDRFYDDNQWIGLAAADAYRHKPDPAWMLALSQTYHFMRTAYDTVSGGGLYWKEGDAGTKNTCSNGPGALLALQWYALAPRPGLLDTAQRLLQWTERWLLAPNGLYYDHLQLPAKVVDKRLYTYNAGTMMHSYVLLFEATKDRQWLAKAAAIGKAAYQHFYKAGRWPSNTWFNAVLLRGYEALGRHQSVDNYMAAFAHDAEELWKRRNAAGLISFGKDAELIEQAGLLEIMARLAHWQRKGKKMRGN